MHILEYEEFLPDDVILPANNRPKIKEANYKDLLDEKLRKEAVENSYKQNPQNKGIVFINILSTKDVVFSYYNEISTLR